jgi:hypothetical protein
MIDSIDFRSFNNIFSATDIKKQKSTKINFPNMLEEVINSVGGVSYNNGVFITYAEEEIIKYTQMVERMFPQTQDKIYCFGRDWLNRQFAVINYKPFTILQFDTNYKDISHIEVNLKKFYEEELIIKHNDLCANDYFIEWDKYLTYSQCAGYITPLSLGGKDTINNLQITDAEVDLELIIQLSENREV